MAGALSSDDHRQADMQFVWLQLLVEKQCECFALCFAVSHIIRDTAAGRSGPITPIGLGTFVDPREQVCLSATTCLCRCYNAACVCVCAWGVCLCIVLYYCMCMGMCVK